MADTPGRNWPARPPRPTTPAHPPGAPCPFCTLPPERVVARSAHALAIRDIYPVTLGHSLIIPRRHIVSLTELESDEARDLWELVRSVRAQIDAEHAPDGYNLGVNDGVAAGQTVMHLHVHLIPRYLGDVRDPRGGVRWAVPEKAAYWAPDRAPDGAPEPED